MKHERQAEACRYHTIAHYRISAKLGEGGMGEVFRATDTKLGRDVAIKIIPESLAQDADRMARFAREAQVLAALNHPNIAAIYGVEDNAIVMELVEGEELRGPIPLAEALPIIHQLIDALEYAHDKGVVHRDLKPANIKITPEGRVKVLDFGLAKLTQASAPVPGDPKSSPTLTMRAVDMGLIMGTAGYMAPEQARGHEADRRADIWSFGVVLFEMLTGSSTFSGQTVSDTLASVLKSDPDWKALPQETPAAIRRLLRRCLERDRKRRLHDIADARLEIDDALAGSEEQSTKPVSRGTTRWWVAGAIISGLVAVAVSTVHFREKPSESVPMRFQIPAPDKASFGATGLALSPDGRRLAFVAATPDGRTMLWVRPLDSVTAHELPGTEGASLLPFWSPDSRFIGFLTSGKVKKVNASGGPPQTVCDFAGMPLGGSCNREGAIIFGSSSGGLFRVAQGAGVPTLLTGLDSSQEELGHVQPSFLPDGRHFLYFIQSKRPDHAGIYLATLDGKSANGLCPPGKAAHTRLPL